MEAGAYSADQDLFEATRSDGVARLRIYRPTDVQVVLGRGSRPEVELELSACAEDGVPVLRRSGGGCAVVLDQGQVVVAWSLRAPGFGDNLRWFARITDRLIGALAGLGLGGLRQAGISDLALGDRKVAGACLHRARDTLFYSASLLIEPRIDLMERYLRHPPREPDYRRGRRHSQFVMGLAGQSPGVDAEGLRAGLTAGLEADSLD